MDPKLTNVSAKSESATCQWLGVAITMKQHIKIQSFLLELARDKIGKMRDHQECVEMSFMDKLQYHYKYMKNIRSCSETLQKARLFTSRLPNDVRPSHWEGARRLRCLRISV